MDWACHGWCSLIPREVLKWGKSGPLFELTLGILLRFRFRLLGQVGCDGGKAKQLVATLLKGLGWCQPKISVLVSQFCKLEGQQEILGSRKLNFSPIFAELAQIASL